MQQRQFYDVPQLYELFVYEYVYVHNMYVYKCMYSVYK